MSAVLAEMKVSDLHLPVAAARAALEAAQADLAALDQRIRGYEQESEVRAAEQHAWRMADTQAVIRNEPRPKPPKARASDADTALPILRGERKEIAARVADAEGRLRRACVEEVERRYRLALDTFAGAVTTLTDAWAELIGIHALLEQAGVRGQPLPPALLDDFSIPAVGTLPPICANHASHFVASASIAWGVGTRAMWAARAEMEADIGMTLPW